MKGNSDKYLSYKEAFARIKAAIEQGFYFEAITISESIISDRILSFALFHKLVPDEKKEPNFYTLIDKTLKFYENSQPESEYVSLFNEVNQWREKRNKCIHSIAKSKPGTPTKQIDEFLVLSSETANQGEKLTRKITKWHQAQKQN